jgi:D-beta-D-heptose 7-phosphate kinase/D-beta-D-heptose 1-phosphate adenosyltransferase
MSSQAVETYEQFALSIRNIGQQRFADTGYDRIVFTNGCFDVLHRGHLEVLNYARNVAGARGAVVVGLNSDEGIKRAKGEDRPIQDEQTRALILIHLRMVDHVITFDEETPYELIKSVQPHVIVKGGDYDPKKVVGADLALVVICPFLEGSSTTNIVEKIRGNS